MPKKLNNFLLNEEQVSGIPNAERKKFLQKIRIVKYLFLNGESSNADICNKFHISLPTSMALLNQMIKEGIVVKKGRGKSEGGRKPDLYGLREGSFFVLSIHIASFETKIALLDNNHNIIKEEAISAEISPDFKIVERLFAWSQQLLKNSQIKMDQILGVGISMPGLVSTKEGKNFTYYSSEQEPESLSDKLEKKFRKPVVLLSDAKSACLAEFTLGLARNKQNILVIYMDWGIGLGIIMGGKMQSGELGFAGEFGHIPMTENGFLCQCGKRGCLETEASGLALVRKAKEGLQDGQTSILNTLTKAQLGKLQPEMIIDAANKGDQFAINILSQIGMKLGKGIATLIQIFNPELIVLEGKIADAHQFITTPIQQSLNTYCMMQLQERTKIELSNLGPNSSLFGGTIAVIDKIFKDQIGLIRSYLN